MKLHFLAKILTAALFVWCLPVFAAAQANGTIRGTVTGNSNNAPLANVSVQITQLRLNSETNENGVYEFANIPPGRYTIVTHIEGFSDKARTVVLTGGATAGVDFELSLTELREEVTVTASGTEESVYESFQSVNSVGSVRLREQPSTSLGEALEREAGVGKRSFGPGSSRPVIRGFDGDRVLVTQDGVRTGSLGSQSGDHGEPVDTLNIERLEVIKGPATLLYGSNAIGGIVNAVTNDENDPHQGFRGAFGALGSTTSKQAGVNGNLEYGYKNFVFNAGGSFQRTGDYDTPLGRVPNSASRDYNATGSVGYYADKGFFNFNYSRDKRRYGIPYAAFIESEGASNDADIDLRMRNSNYRLRGGFRNLDAPIRQMNFAVNYSDYRHEELEGDAVGTNFFNRNLFVRSVFEQRPYKILGGRFGFETFDRSYETIGAEALVQGKVEQRNFAVFALEELNFERVAFQLGGRVEHNGYDPRNADLRDRSFTGFSGAAAIRVRVWEGGSFITNFTSSYRAPALEELYNNGAHVGTVSFEIGNENLERERSNGIEFSLKQNLRRLRLDGSFFYYSIDNFVFFAPEDADNDNIIDREDGLPVQRYLQGKSSYIGADLRADYDLNKFVNVFFDGDIVKARLKNGDVPLPRITPARARVGLDFRYQGLSVRPEAVFVSRKSAGKIFPLETPTAGYGIINVNGSYTFGNNHVAHIFAVGGFNLTNKLYRNHLSFIKDLAPEIGRGVRGSYTVRFF